MLGFIRGGLEDFSISRERTPGGWGIPFPIAENGRVALREDGSWDPEAGVIYVWYDALINYITGAGFPDDLGGLRALVAGRPARHRQGHRPVPHDLLAGDAVERRAGGAAPRLGPRLAAGRRRRADEQEPRQLPRPERLRRPRSGQDGARYVVLREVPFDRDAEVSWDSFVRRYNADLANDFGNLRQPDGLDDEPLPRRRATGAARGRRVAARRGLGGHAPGHAERLEACLLHDALAELWEFVGGANKVGRRRAAVGPGQGRKAGDEAAGERLRGVLGRPAGGVPARRARGGAVHAGDGTARPRPARLRLSVRRGRQRRPADPGDELAWGAHAGEAGRVTAPEPLFPRLDIEAAETPTGA